MVTLASIVTVAPADGVAVSPAAGHSKQLPATQLPAQLPTAKIPTAKAPTAKLPTQKRPAARLRHRRHAARANKTRQLTVHLDTAPTANISPLPDFVADCGPQTPSPSCISEALSAIDNARTIEGLAPMTFSTTAFSALPPLEQLFVVTNLERTARGLAPAVALTAQLNAVAAAGATANTDPSLSGWTLTGDRPAVEWSSNWAGDLSGFGADYYWMYADGLGVNIDCPTATASGCWQHRTNVLMPSPTATSCGDAGTPGVVMGAAFLGSGYQNTPSIAEIYVGECGGLPSDVTFTWASAKALLGIA